MLINRIERNFKMKTSSSELEAANKIVPKIDVETAIEKYKTGKAVFIDVRDGLDINQTGTIKGALRIPRGFIEFAADPETPFHNNALQKDADIVLVCGAGGMAALTGKTLVEMGFQSVSNVGGFSSWKEGGGPVE
jgi:rhodanese-related sulfurtransferase